MGAEFNKIPQSAFIKATVKEISAEMIQKDILHVLTYMWTLNAESRMVVSGGGGGGEEWGDVGQRVWSFGG